MDIIKYAKAVKRKATKLYYGSYWKKNAALSFMLKEAGGSADKDVVTNTHQNGAKAVGNRTVDKRKKVVQVVGSLYFGDAVGNDVLAIQRALKEAGYVTGIFSSAIDKRLPEHTAFHLEQVPKLSEDDIVIYHFGSADRSFELIRDLQCKKILRYHNVTPPEFFAGFDKNSERSTTNGLKQIAAMKDFFDYGMVDSEFNKQDLVRMGHSYPIDVVPILISFEDYKRKPSEAVIEKYGKDDYQNIVFVGRIVPNKKDDDLIRCFADYKRTYQAKSRLILVGNYAGQDTYYNKLQDVMKEEELQDGKDVILTGHISFADILAYYSVADLFLCLSEHEGFCVPLIEAMFFEKPILAYDMAAVPQTLGDAGMLIADKTPKYVAEKMHEILTSEELKEQYRKAAKRKIEALQYDVVKGQILKCLEKM